MLPADHRLYIPSRYPAAPRHYRVCRHCRLLNKPLFSVRSFPSGFNSLPADSPPVLLYRTPFCSSALRKSALPCLCIYIIVFLLQSRYPCSLPIRFHLFQLKHQCPILLHRRYTASFPVIHGPNCLNIGSSPHVPTADLCHPGTMHFHHRVSHIPAPAVPEAAENSVSGCRGSCLRRICFRSVLPGISVSISSVSSGISVSGFLCLFCFRLGDFRFELLCRFRLGCRCFCFVIFALSSVSASGDFCFELLCRFRLGCQRFCFVIFALFCFRFGDFCFELLCFLPTRLPALLFRYLRSLLFPLRRLPFQNSSAVSDSVLALLFRYLRSLLFPLPETSVLNSSAVPIRLSALLFRCLRSLLFPASETSVSNSSAASDSVVRCFCFVIFALFCFHFGDFCFELLCRFRLGLSRHLCFE